STGRPRRSCNWAARCCRTTSLPTSPARSATPRPDAMTGGDGSGVSATNRPPSVPGRIELAWDLDASDGQEALTAVPIYRSMRPALMVIGGMVLLAGTLSLSTGDPGGIAVLATGLTMLLLAGPVSRFTSRQAARRLPHLTGPCRAWAVPGVGLTVITDHATS